MKGRLNMKTLRDTGLCALFAFIILIAFYVGMNKDLCSRIDTFSIKDQTAMKLDATACAKPWYSIL